MRVFNLGWATQPVRRTLAGWIAPEMRNECARHEALVEQASDGIFLADLTTGRYTYVNSAGARMLGYTPKEIVGKTIMELLPPEQLPRLAASKVLQQRGVIHVTDYQLKRKDGVYIPTEVSAKILPDGRWQGFVRDVSERKRLESALKQTVDDLNRAQAVARVGSWRIDATTNTLVWSDETYRIFGVARGQKMTYAAFIACVHPDDRAFVEARWSAALHGESYHFEHRIVAQGETRWVCEDAELKFDPQGVLLGGIGTVQDISDRKHAELALARAHQEEQRLRAELEQVTQASLSISDAVASLATAEVASVLQTIVLQAQTLTRAQYAALGIGGAEDRPFDSWVYSGMSPETAAAIGRHPRPVGTLGAVARNGRLIRAKNVHDDPAFRGFPAHHPGMNSFMGVPIHYRGAAVGNLYLANKVGAAEFTDQDERIIKMLAARVGVAIETATLYRGETLRRSWLQTVINQMPEGVMLFDERGHLNIINDAMRSLSCGRILGHDEFGNPIEFEVLMPDGAPQPLGENFAVRALKGEITRAKEARLRTAGGAVVPVLINAAPVRGGSGAGVLGATVIVQEISKLKELEQLREEWASIVAHDLRQPVTVVAAAADVLSHLHGEAVSEREAKVLSGIKNAAKRLNRMIAELLDVSLLDARRLTVHPEPVDLMPLINEVVEQQSDLGPENQVEIEMPGPLMVVADTDRFKQIIENLLSNAVKYGAPGSAIGIRVYARAGEAVVAVTNRGPGIAADQLGKLFRRYWRTPKARAERPTAGLGLGLYIAHGLVEAQGGRIWVESTPGQTTTFSFTLPLLNNGWVGRDERAAQAPAPPP